MTRQRRPRAYEIPSEQIARHLAEHHLPDFQDHEQPLTRADVVWTAVAVALAIGGIGVFAWATRAFSYSSTP